MTSLASQGRSLGNGFDEARYNLATRIMSNGVEVIVAGDKSTLPGNPLRILPTGLYKPHTLPPTTIQDHMLMLLPNDFQVKKNLTIS